MAVIAVLGMRAIDKALEKDARAERAEQAREYAQKHLAEAYAKQPDVRATRNQGTELRGDTFVIGVPPGWEGRLVGGGLDMMLTGSRGFINVMAERQPGRVDLRQAERDYLAGIEDSAGGHFKRFGGGVATTAGGVPAREFDYQVKTSDGGDAKVRSTMFAHNGTTYVVSFASTPGDFDSQLDDLGVALQGWRFTD